MHHNMHNLSLQSHQTQIEQQQINLTLQQPTTADNIYTHPAGQQQQPTTKQRQLPQVPQLSAQHQVVANLSQVSGQPATISSSPPSAASYNLPSSPGAYDSSNQDDTIFVQTNSSSSGLDHPAAFSNVSSRSMMANMVHNVVEHNLPPSGFSLATHHQRQQQQQQQRQHQRQMRPQSSLDLQDNYHRHHPHQQHQHLMSTGSGGPVDHVSEREPNLHTKQQQQQQLSNQTQRRIPPYHRLNRMASQDYLSTSPSHRNNLIITQQAANANPMLAQQQQQQSSPRSSSSSYMAPIQQSSSPPIQPNQQQQQQQQQPQQQHLRHFDIGGYKQDHHLFQQQHNNRLLMKDNNNDNYIAGMSSDSELNTRHLYGANSRIFHAHVAPKHISSGVSHYSDSAASYNTATNYSAPAGRNNNNYMHQQQQLQQQQQQAHQLRHQPHQLVTQNTISSGICGRLEAGASSSAPLFSSSPFTTNVTPSRHQSSASNQHHNRPFLQSLSIDQHNMFASADNYQQHHQQQQQQQTTNCQSINSRTTTSPHQHLGSIYSAPIDSHSHYDHSQMSIATRAGLMSIEQQLAQASRNQAHHHQQQHLNNNSRHEAFRSEHLRGSSQEEQQTVSLTSNIVHNSLNDIHIGSNSGNSSGSITSCVQSALMNQNQATQDTTNTSQHWTNSPSSNDLANHHASPIHQSKQTRLTNNTALDHTATSLPQASNINKNGDQYHSQGANPYDTSDLHISSNSGLQAFFSTNAPMANIVRSQIVSRSNDDVSSLHHHQPRLPSGGPHSQYQQQSGQHQQQHHQQHQQQQQHHRHQLRKGLTSVGSRSNLLIEQQQQRNSRLSDSSPSHHHSATSSALQLAPTTTTTRPPRATAPSTPIESNTSRSESSSGPKCGQSSTNISGLTKKSNSATQLSITGTKNRLGFRKKQVTSFSVHRSEEVVPLDARHLVKQGSSVSEGESSLSGDSYSNWSNVGFKQHSEELTSMNFIEGLGKGQMISRQGLASPYLGDIQLSLCDRRGNLEVEVIRARNLVAKANKIIPMTYVKLYLVKNRKCLAKAKTTLTTKRTLDPLFQQQLTFHEDYHGCILQSIVWANFGKMDKKNFMGIAQISIDDLELSETVISWYKLFLPSSLQTMPSKSLRHTLLSNSTESFTNTT